MFFRQFSRSGAFFLKYAQLQAEIQLIWDSQSYEGRNQASGHEHIVFEVGINIIIAILWYSVSGYSGLYAANMKHDFWIAMPNADISDIALCIVANPFS